MADLAVSPVVPQMEVPAKLAHRVFSVVAVPPGHVAATGTSNTFTSSWGS